MAARYYERNTSGMNFDRFLDRFDENTLVTMKRHYWTAKQLVRSKLGKREDDHLLASDLELDSKLTLFRCVRDTSENMLACIENYQGYLLDEILVENELGRYLKEQGKKEKREEISTIMRAVGRALIFSSHQRASVRPAIVRFYQELHVFTERAIADCAQTVEAVERSRLEYRGSLLWMKKSSEELDPDTNQLEGFREAQSAVRANKERLDKLKLDTLQKVDLLSASRSNLLGHLLGKYLEYLASYYEKTAKAYTALASNLAVFQHYEFEILTDLIEPSRRAARTARQKSQEMERHGDRVEPEGPAIASDTEVGTLLDLNDETGSLKELLFGRESPLEERAEEEEEREDSPLGVLEDHTHQPEPAQEAIKLGPLLPIVSNVSGTVPKLSPPPGDAGSSTSITGYESSRKVDELPSMWSKPLSSKSDQMFDYGRKVDSRPRPPFPNPFEPLPTNEWDILLSQCDNIEQSSSDLL